MPEKPLAFYPLAVDVNIINDSLLFRLYPEFASYGLDSMLRSLSLTQLFFSITQVNKDTINEPRIQTEERQEDSIYMMARGES